MNIDEEDNDENKSRILSKVCYTSNNLRHFPITKSIHTINKKSIKKITVKTNIVI